MSSALTRWPWLALPMTVAVYCTSNEGIHDTNSSSASTGTGAASASSTSSSASATTASAGGGASATCPPPKPPGVPDGWTDYLDWQCNGCKLYIPTSKAVLPPPIAWEKCPVDLGNANCEWMAPTWTQSKSPVGGGRFSTTTTGTPLLGFVRSGATEVDPYVMLIAEPDGPVHTSVLVPRTAPGCFFQLYALGDDRVIYKIHGHDAGDDWATSPHQGAIGGFVDDLHPPVLGDFGEEGSWACSSSRVYRWVTGLTVYTYDWNMQGKTFITSPAVDPEGLQPHQPVTWKDAFFWTSSNLYQSGINSWTAADGARPFIRYVGDATKAAGNLGTDGVNLVWSYAEGKKPSEENSKYPVRSIMSSPYTTDPAKVVAKRLRSDPSGSINGQPFRVACGHAAHGGKIFPVVVVRISDGVSWIVPKSPNAADYVVDVLGLTCEHVYLQGYFGGRYNIARIRLDSLGPGTPPD
jgi:hypothetical protein